MLCFVLARFNNKQQVESKRSYYIKNTKYRLGQNSKLGRKKFITFTLNCMVSQDKQKI